MVVEEKRFNNLTGKEWLQNSFSIWRDLRKTKEERELHHPASFPVALAEKLLLSFSKKDYNVIDPFVGIGTTLVAAEKTDRKGVGIELSEEFCAITNSRLIGQNQRVINGDSFAVLKQLEPHSFDLCLTSPPYWDILNQIRSADGKTIKNYSDEKADLGNISDYKCFIHTLGDLFTDISRVLKPGGYCLINVMDIRKKHIFYPLHMDLSIELIERGFKFDDLIIWDRQSDYNNMRPLGYPYKFRINKVHEYILIFISEVNTRKYEF